MRELTNIRTATDARITILRGGKIRLSARACAILGIRPVEPYITFYEDHGKIFIANAHSPSGYMTSPLQRRAELNSSRLAQILAESLNGYGIYRIKEEDYTLVNGATCYRISDVKYEK